MLCFSKNRCLLKYLITPISKVSEPPEALQELLPWVLQEKMGVQWLWDRWNVECGTCVCWEEAKSPKSLVCLFQVGWGTPRKATG